MVQKGEHLLIRKIAADLDVHLGPSRVTSIQSFCLCQTVTRRQQTNQSSQASKSDDTKNGH